MLGSRHTRLTAAAAATVGVLVASPPAMAAVTGQWFFSEVSIAAGQPIGNPIPDGQQFQSGGLPIIHAADAASGGSSILAANLDAAHPKSVYFPGWNDANASGQIAAAESMLSSDPAFETLGGTTNGIDTGTAFDPEAASAFKVTAWVKPDDPALVPTSVGSGTSVSPNIVQKGVRQAGASLHFWKMSLAMTTNTSGQKRWFPFCEFKGESVASPGTIVQPKPGYSPSAQRILLDPGVAYKLECSKNATGATLGVTPAGGTQVTRTESVSGAFNVANDRPLSIGKKPASVLGADAYAGVLDNLVIDKS